MRDYLDRNVSNLDDIVFMADAFGQIPPRRALHVTSLTSLVPQMSGTSSQLKFSLTASCAPSIARA